MKFDKVVTINPKVDKVSKAGQPYSVFEIVGSTEQGIKTKSITLQTLQYNSALSDQLHTLKVGDSVEFVEEQKGQYKNVVGAIIGPGTKGEPYSSSKSNNSAPKSNYVDYKERDYGLQVGNALNNAAALIAAKAEKGSLKEVAERILYVGEELKQHLKEGKYKVASSASEITKTVVDFDIGFGE